MNIGFFQMSDALGGTQAEALRAVLLAVALDVGTTRWQTLILT